MKCNKLDSDTTLIRVSTLMNDMFHTIQKESFAFAISFFSTIRL